MRWLSTVTAESLCRPFVLDRRLPWSTGSRDARRSWAISLKDLPYQCIPLAHRIQVRSDGIDQIDELCGPGTQPDPPTMQDRNERGPVA